MTKIRLDSEKVRSVLIKVSAKSMPERMTGDPVRPAQSVFVCMDVTSQKKSVNRERGIGLFRKKPSLWSVIFKPVFRKDIQSIGRKLGITIIAVFAMSNMNPHVFTINIFIL